MTWLPDWSKPVSEYTIYMPDEDMFTFDVPTVEEPEGYYRLMDIPYDESETLRWGDLIRAKKIDGGTGEGTLGFDYLEFIELVERAEHTHSNGSIISGRKDAGFIMAAIMEAGGFWANDPRFGVDIFIPPDFDIDKWNEGDYDPQNSTYTPTDWNEGVGMIIKSQQRVWGEISELSRQIESNLKVKKDQAVSGSYPLDKAIKDLELNVDDEESK